jgi:hypothetical protein
MIPCGSVTIIRAIHLLEHFGPNDAEHALHEWVRCLCRRGVLEMAMPDLQHLALMTRLGNITREAFLRDVCGHYPPPDWLRNDKLNEYLLRLTQGVGNWAETLWPFTLQCLYEETWKSDMPQAHRWGYCEESLRWHMQEAGLREIVIEHEGTSLHAWGVKL